MLNGMTSIILMRSTIIDPQPNLHHFPLIFRRWWSLISAFAVPWSPRPMAARRRRNKWHFDRVER